MFGLGGSSSKSSSSSSGFGYGVDMSNTYLDPTQARNQQQLLGRYNNQAGSMGQTPWMDQQRNQTLGGLYQGANQANQYGQQMAGASQYGMGQLAQFAQQGNPYLQQQIAGLAQDAGQFYNEQILPGIGNQAQLAGQRGSSRQGIAEALGAQRVGQEFMQSANQLRSNAYGQQQQAAGQLAALGQQGAGQMYGLAQQGYANQGQLANQYAQTGYMGQQLPFQIGQSIIGSPQVLSQSFGMDYSEQQSQSKGSGQSLNLGYG